MKKNRGFIIISIIELILIVFLGVVLFNKWYKPYKEEQDFKNSVKNISVTNVNQIITDFKDGQETKETLALIPEITNDVLNDTNWVCYSDNTVIAFKDGYFVWYKNSDLTTDNAMIGQFSYYKGEKAFNLIGDSLEEDMERSENDSILMLDIISNKVNGEETLESTQSMYLFGYNTGNLMTFIDISSYSEYTFVKVESEDVDTENSEDISEDYAENNVSTDTKDGE